jgi:hypothetical protein
MARSTVSLRSLSNHAREQNSHYASRSSRILRPNDPPPRRVATEQRNSPIFLSVPGNFWVSGEMI